MPRGLTSEGFYVSGIHFCGGAQGSDMTLDGSTVMTLTGDLVVDSLFMKDNSAILTNGYHIYARRFIRMIENAGISNSGQDGTAGGSGGGDGEGGAGGAGAAMWGGSSGGDSDVDGDGEATNSLSEATGGDGGAGSGGGNPGGNGGTAHWDGDVNGTYFQPMIPISGLNGVMTPVAIFGGAGGGGGGNGGGGNKGGGGGGGGGNVFIATPLLIMDGQTNIESHGGNGGDGAVGNAGGGGGGSGGTIILVVGQVIMRGSSSFSRITTPGGTGGAGAGTGAAGSDGIGGYVYVFSEFGTERQSTYRADINGVIPTTLQT
jgi:hypothetical protein